MDTEVACHAEVSASILGWGHLLFYFFLLSIKIKDPILLSLEEKIIQPRIGEREKMRGKWKLVIGLRQKGLNDWKAVAPNGAVVKGVGHI